MASPGLDVINALRSNPQAQYEASKGTVTTPGQAGYDPSRGPVYRLGTSVTPEEETYIKKRNNRSVLGSSESSLLGG